MMSRELFENEEDLMIVLDSMVGFIYLLICSKRRVSGMHFCFCDGVESWHPCYWEQ